MAKKRVDVSFNFGANLARRSGKPRKGRGGKKGRGKKGGGS